MSDYRVFCLKVRSEIPLPELLLEETTADPDIMIARGLVGAKPGDADLQVDEAGVTLVIPDVAQFRIEGGREIIVEAADRVPETNVRLFLLGSAMGALLHQRGLLPLHANAVEIAGKAVAFMGESGAGKSTLATWFHDQGYRVLADDVCVVSLGLSGSATVLPGLRRVRMWDDALRASGRNPADFPRSYAQEPIYEKYDVPIEIPDYPVTPLQLAAIYLLERGSDAVIRPVEGMTAVELLFDHTYRGEFVKLAKTSTRHWKTCVETIRRVPLFRAERVWDLHQLPAGAESFARHAAGVIAQSR